MEIPHLETFCKAAELLNFTGAAESLALTQAAVSQRIRALEQDVGVDLFDRQSGRVYLTPQGKLLYDFAQRILALQRHARTALGQVPADVSGDLHLGASAVPAEHLLPGLLGVFQRRYPKIHVLADVADSAMVLQALDEGRISLALVGRPGPSSSTESKAFARDHLVLVAAPSHRWVKRAKIRIDELREEPITIREPGSGSRACLETGLH